ncbi:MAG: GGDEF domain-containing protein [Lachnospiraceae bacterium]|nr:GGDEF domain-containing protein [Lachnospiraceae bacterium]
MYYSSIGLLAAMILLIENQDILLNRTGAFDKPAWKEYRKFLIAILVYYTVDILWGTLESHRLATLLFIDTSVYFVAMAAGVLFWTQYFFTYLDEKNRFGEFLVYSGRIIAGAVALLSVVNIFVPIMFSVDPDGTYHPLGFRYVILACQILLLLSVCVHAFAQLTRKKNAGEGSLKYRTLALFGLIMTVFLLGQLWFPFLPMYALAYLLGTCLLRAVVIGDEKEKYRQDLKEASKITELKQSITALLDNMPALSFSKDAETGVYLACNQAFAEYAHKETPEGVVGLTDAQIFDPETAGHFVEDDRMALSMDEPYIFFEDVPDAVGNQRQFQTTKLKFIDAAGRLCTLGMSQDVTDMVRIQRENATTKEAYEKARSTGIIFTHIAQTLARSYADLYYVNIDSGEYIEYRAEEEGGALTEVRRGDKFFESCRKEGNIFIYPEDRNAFLKAMDKETLLDAIDKNGSFFMTCRLLTDNRPVYVNLKVSRMEDDERFIVIGVTNIDEQVKQQQAAERAQEEHIAYTRLNALSGDYLCVYVVDPKTGHFREYSTTSGFEPFALPKEGEDFFETSRKKAENTIYPEDHDRFLAMFTKEAVLSEVEQSGIFAISYRFVMNGRPTYVRLKAAMVEEEKGRRLVVGLNDIDSHARQEADYARRLAQAQNQANVDALTGVKNKHAYLDEEVRLDRQIREHRAPEFAVVILDINDLKKINDTEGHQAGDQYIRDACKIICDTFKRSPVFRIGGDEFAVLVQGNDFMSIEELIGRVNDHNDEASRTGGIVIACGMSKFEDDNCVAAVFERADIRMYENKNRLKGL